MKNKFPIDIVIPWVDQNDKVWRKKRDFFLRKENNISNVDSSSERYRDWGLLKFLLRGIEKFAPWVRNVFLITDNQVPNWINLKCKNLILINHSDFIPKKYLPTFSANPIELNMHRINDLSEHFIYFNDDTFITREIKPSDFFNKKGLPKYPAIEKSPSINHYKIGCNIQLNDIFEINQIFQKKDIKRKHIIKWYFNNPVSSFFNFFNDLLSPKYFCGLYSEHIPSPFLKSKISECWNIFGKALNSTSLHKFRSIEDVNQYLLKFYLICTNNYSASRPGELWNRKLHNAPLNEICNSIIKQKKKILVIYDDNQYSFYDGKESLYRAFKKILPEKSIFEK